MKRIFRSLYRPIALDLGCANAPNTRGLGQVVHVDIVVRDSPPPRMIVADMLQAPSMFREWPIGTVYMIDSIEHLEQPNACKLLEELDKLAERIVVFVPWGPLWLNEETGPSGHHSYWYPVDFEARGFTVWEWPNFHVFPDGTKSGAILAWKDIKSPRCSSEELSMWAGVPI
jgi:hypothetical protein